MLSAIHAEGSSTTTGSVAGISSGGMFVGGGSGKTVSDMAKEAQPPGLPVFPIAMAFLAIIGAVLLASKSQSIFLVIACVAVGAVLFLSSLFTRDRRVVQWSRTAMCIRCNCRFTA